MFCSGESIAKKRYERDVLRFMALYVVVILCASWFVKHDGGQKFFLYFWSVLPAIPVLAVMVRMGRYLQEENDEYLRLMAMHANTGALPPFVSFIIFCVGMAVTQLVRRLKSRTSDE
jgi:hypothetical protein